jgi:hypothetical protein
MGASQESVFLPVLDLGSVFRGSSQGLQEALVRESRLQAAGGLFKAAVWRP